MTVRTRTKRRARRYLLGFFMGSLAAVSLLWVMQFMIASGEAAVTGAERTGFLEFVQVHKETTPPPKKERPEMPPEPEEQPKFPEPDPGNTTNGTGIPLQRPAPDPIGELEPRVGGLGMAEGDHLPIFKVQPVYPGTALSRGLEGHCDLEFTVTRLGTTADARIIDCTSSVFERASIQALLKFKYKPRVVDGTPIAVTGLRHRISFRISD